MARPETPLPPDAETIIATHARAGGTDKMIANVMGITKTTLQRRFGAILVKKRAERQLALATKQTELAESGNPTMLIWLGKQGTAAGGLDQREMLEYKQKPNFKDMPDDELDRFRQRKIKPTVTGGMRVVPGTGAGARGASGA